MKRRFPFHSNAVWPPAPLVAVFVSVYGLVAGCLWLMDLRVPDMGKQMSASREILNVRSAILAGAGGIYALFRLCRFHPACNQAYAGWLKLSPWTANKPLPAGPVHPVWQDAAVIGVLTALAAWHAHVWPYLPALVFGLVYLGGLTVLLCVTRRWGSCLALGFLWPAFMLPDISQAGSMAIALAILVAAWHGYRASLRSFPWEYLGSVTRPANPVWQMDIKIEIAPPVRTPANVGWPFSVISPKLHFSSISTLRAFCLSAVLGWWSFCFIQRAKLEPSPEVIVTCAIFAALGRLSIYCGGLVPPFNLFGRLSSGRIFIPGFDKVFLTPLACVCVALVGGMIIRRSGSLYPATEALVVASSFFVLLTGSPTLKRWRLTGKHRFRPRGPLNANKQQLRPI